MAGFRHEAAQRTTVRHTKGGEYEFNVTVDAEYYQQRYIEELSPAIEEKMSWLESGGGTKEQHGVSPHAGKGKEEKLNREAKGER